EACRRRSTADADEFAQWRVHAANWRGELQAPLDHKPWTSKHEGSRRQLSKRALDLVDCAAMQSWKRARLSAAASSTARADVLHNCIVDVSQSHSRHPFSSEDGVAHCLTTSSRLFSFRRERLLQGIEHMFLQGYPVNTKLPENMSEHAAKHLAGEAVALPCLAVLVWSIFQAKGFP
ncbi:unnamed protein product, partial [Symbiodinium microadriaticum]